MVSTLGPFLGYRVGIRVGKRNEGIALSIDNLIIRIIRIGVVWVPAGGLQGSLPKRLVRSPRTATSGHA